jgi:para-nitrobenzyl esterase
VRHRGRWARALRLLCVATAVLALSAACSPGTNRDDGRTGTAAPAPAVVSTTGGEARGVRTGGALSFYGIPYAAPPVGDLRWQQPLVAQPWHGVLDASRRGHPCMQTTPTGSLADSASEDCLFVNLSRPATDRPGRKLPVMVWIHGGGFVSGSANAVDTSALAAAGPAVVVAVNYRLGAFGYLALPALNAESPGDAGSYAVGDLIAALHWVRANAKAFGGDPENITVFGESAGSVGVCALLASPRSAGLFQRAVMQSGPCGWTLPSIPAAEQTGTGLAQRLACTDVATAAQCLRSLPARTIVAAQGSEGDILRPFLWAPAVGGPILPQGLLDAFRSGQFAKVPVLIGTIRDEGRDFTRNWMEQGAPITDERFTDIVRTHFPDRVGQVLAAYPPDSASPRERLARLITDAMFTCPSTATAALLAAQGVPVYMYEFDVPDQPPVSQDAPAGASHGWDLKYLFPTGSGEFGSAARRALSAAMVGYWTRFAADGDPNGDGGGTPSAWPRFDPRHLVTGNDRMQLYAGAIRPAAGTWAAHHCDLWG